MKFITTILFTLCLLSNVYCQEVEQLHESARAYMRQGDYSNAALVLEKASKADPTNLEISKDLAVNYMVLKKNNKALETLLPFLDNGQADDQTYQLAANIYNVLDQRKESENIYKRGIKKFPASGALYNEYGQMLMSRQDLNAIKLWEKGIQNDPSFAGNYYNATRFYTLNTNRVWSAIYGEIFILLEPGTGRTAEIKNDLLENYKRMLSDEDAFSNLKGKQAFEKAYIQTILKEKSSISGGVTPESLTMLRTRFLLDWTINEKKFPFYLFQLQKKMLEEGMFEAYNQWLFGTVYNLSSYQNWINIHPEEYTLFSNYQKGRIFTFPGGQYYH